VSAAPACISERDNVAAGSTLQLSCAQAQQQLFIHLTADVPAHAAEMFMTAALLAEAAASGSDTFAKLPQQLGKAGLAFFTRTLGSGVQSTGGSRPATARQGAPSSRPGPSYADLAAMHPRPQLQQAVRSPFISAQVGFVPSRSARWNKPISYNAHTFCQRSDGTYAATDARFETLLTRSNNSNPHFRDILGSKLTPYKRQIRMPGAPACNMLRAPADAREASYVAAARGAGAAADQSVSTPLSELHRKHAAQAGKAVRSARTESARATPLQRPPWRSMVRHEDDSSMVALHVMQQHSTHASGGLQRSVQPEAALNMRQHGAKSARPSGRASHACGERGTLPAWTTGHAQEVDRHAPLAFA
jgi:hypothetical protein